MQISPLNEVDIRKFDLSSYEALYRSFRWEIPEKFNLGEALCDRHAVEGKIALFYEDETGRCERFTFSDLMSLSNRFANYLAELGLKTGNRIAILLPQGPEMAISLLGTYKAGCIAVTMSTLFGWDAIKYRLEDSGAIMLIVDGMTKEKVTKWREVRTLRHVLIVRGAVGEGEVGFEDALQASQRFKVIETEANSPAHMYYTSGTTGPPKGALHAHRFVLGHVPCWQLAYDVAPKPGDIYWTPADWAWIGGSGDLVFPAWYFGMPVVAHGRRRRFDPHEALSIIERYKVTCAFIPPTALRMIMKAVPEPRREYSLEGFRSILSGGEPVGADMLKWGRESLGANINEIYGQTEANLLVTSSAALKVQRPNAAGKPCPGHIVEVMDEHGNPLPPYQVGEITVKAPDPVIFLGYWGKPEATRKKFLGDWLLTGDLGYKDEDGYVWFKARADDLIKSAGYRIGPSEVEEAINAHPAVLESAVIGKQDAIRGQIVKAYVVLKEGYEATEEIKEQIVALVKAKLAEYAYPREIEFIDEIPKTVTGKIKRYELRDRETKGFETLSKE